MTMGLPSTLLGNLNLDGSDTVIDLITFSVCTFEAGDFDLKGERFN